MSVASIKKLFPGKSLYEILNINKDSDASVIKRAYYKAALRYVSAAHSHAKVFPVFTCIFEMQHPDKAGDAPDATEKFQTLSFVYQLLSDEEKKAVYDRTGSIEEATESGAVEVSDTWYGIWRNVFPSFTKEDILSFEKEYRGSDEEAEDVINAYVLNEGDMDGIITCVMCSRDEDVPRFVSIIHAALESKKVDEYPAFTEIYGASSRDQTTEQKKKAEAAAKKRAQATKKEAKEAEEYLEELQKAHKKKTGSKSSTPLSLEDMIRERQKQRMGTFSSSIEQLEAKYAGKGALLEDGSVKRRRKNK